MSARRRAHTLKVAPTAEAVAEAAADEVVALLEAAMAWRGEAHLCLAGGSTPRLLHRALVQRAFDGWPHVHVWFGDERCVPPDHPDSNAGMAQATLLDHVAVPAAQVHRLQGELTPGDAAGRYDAALAEQAARLGRDVPLLDVLILGMGSDGHTASVFPGSPLLDGAPDGAAGAPDAAVERGGRWCAAVYVPALDARRLTLTPELLQAAQATLVLAPGASKHDPLMRLLRDEAPVDTLPIRLLEEARGDVAWFVDVAAVAGT